MSSNLNTEPLIPYSYHFSVIFPIPPRSGQGWQVAISRGHSFNFPTMMEINPTMVRIVSFDLGDDMPHHRSSQHLYDPLLLVSYLVAQSCRLPVPGIEKYIPDCPGLYHLSWVSRLCLYITLLKEEMTSPRI